MKRLAFALLPLLVSCGTGATRWTAASEVRDACTRVSHLEVHLRGTVDRVLGIRRTRSGAHEGFVFDAELCAEGSTACSPTAVRVEDNVDITGAIPLRSNEPIEVYGQYECNDGVVHWTHRDPRGRHEAGYIVVDGRRYQ